MTNSDMYGGLTFSEKLGQEKCEHELNWRNCLEYTWGKRTWCKKCNKSFDKLNP